MLSTLTLSARLRRDEKGATAVEYGIMVALIAVVIIVAVTLLGGQMRDPCYTDSSVRRSTVETYAAANHPCRWVQPATGWPPVITVY